MLLRRFHGHTEGTGRRWTRWAAHLILISFSSLIIFGRTFASDEDVDIFTETLFDNLKVRVILQINLLYAIAHVIMIVITD